MGAVEPPRAIGILGFGAMGAGLAGVLRARGFEVATSLAGRSARTRARAEASGVIVCGDVGELIARVDTFLSVVPADQAEPLADAVADALGKRARPLHFVDCNSMTPSRTRRVAERVTAAGAVFSDGGIIGPPPSAGRSATRLFVSGPNRDVLSVLDMPELRVRALGDSLTQATEMKVLFAAINKGAVGLLVNILAASEAAGLSEAVVAEADSVFPGLIDVVRRQGSDLAGKAARWAIEMDDVAVALDDLGCDAGYHETAAAGYRRLARALEGADGAVDLDRVIAAWGRGQAERG